MCRRVVVILFLILCAGVVAIPTQAAAQPFTSADQKAGSPADPATPPGAQRLTNPPPEERPPQTRGDRGSDAPTAYLTYKTPYEFWLTGLTIALLAAMGTLLSLMAWLGKLTPDFLKAFIILTVVFAALFLIVAGYTDKQTAPVFSLLGTIIGYLFGRMGSPDDKPAEAEPKPVPAPSPTSPSPLTPPTPSA